MTDRPDIFLDISVNNSLNTGSDHRMIRGKERIDTKFERAKMVAQPKKVSIGKLQQHRRELQVEIKNRFALLVSIPPDDLDSRGDATAKMIHEATISIAVRYKWETWQAFNKYQTTEREAQENEEELRTTRQH